MNIQIDKKQWIVTINNKNMTLKLMLDGTYSIKVDGKSRKPDELNNSQASKLARMLTEASAKLGEHYFIDEQKVLF